MIMWCDDNLDYSLVRNFLTNLKRGVIPCAGRSKEGNLLNSMWNIFIDVENLDWKTSIVGVHFVLLEL